MHLSDEHIQKSSPCARHEDVWKNGVMAPPFLNLCTRCGLERPDSLPGTTPGGRCPRYSLNGRLGEAQSRLRRFGEDKNIITVLRIQPLFLGRTARSHLKCTNRDIPERSKLLRAFEQYCMFTLWSCGLLHHFVV